jgi:hypothetical protein
MERRSKWKGKSLTPSVVFSTFLYDICSVHGVKEQNEEAGHYDDSVPMHILTMLGVVCTRIQSRQPWNLWEKEVHVQEERNRAAASHAAIVLAMN